MITDNVLTVRSFKNERYKTKEYRKKDFKPFLYLSMSEFKKYSKENDVTVAGSVKINQKHYEDIESADDPEKVLGEKYRKHIIGIFQAELDGVYTVQSFDDDSLNLSKKQKFDLYEKLSFYHCIGYAYVGGKKFVKLCKFSLIPFLILLLLLLGLLICLLFPVNDDPAQTPPMADQQPYSDAAPAEPDPGSNFAVVVKREYHISADNPAIELKNYIKNEKSISYNVFTDSGTYIGSTGLIEPGNKADLNVYPVLSSPGEYRLRLNAVSYNEDGSENPIDGNIFTTVVVE